MTRGDQIRIVNVLNKIEYGKQYALGYDGTSKQTVVVKVLQGDGSWSEFIHLSDTQLKRYVNDLFRVLSDRLGDLNMAMAGI